MGHGSCASYIVAEHKWVRGRSRKGALKASVHFVHKLMLLKNGLLLGTFASTIPLPQTQLSLSLVFYFSLSPFLSTQPRQTIAKQNCFSSENKLSKFSLKVHEIFKDIWRYLEHQLF